MVTWQKNYSETKRLLDEFGSPLYVYDQKIIERQIERYQQAFADFPTPVKNFFAVKALPNPAILQILKQRGMGFDCSSVPELQLAEMVRTGGPEIMFTSNNTSDQEFAAALQAGATVNFDDISLVRHYLEQGFKLPEVAFCRFNPGDLELGENAAIMGRPSEAKYGMPRQQIIEAFKLLKRAGVKRLGLHTMLLSNETDSHFHLEIAKSLFTLAVELHNQAGVQLEAINLGGGFGVAYQPNQPEFDIKKFASQLKKLYLSSGLDKIGSPKIYTELGRFITADSGFLLTRVLNRKDSHRIYIGVDATMANLMRPGIYGAYHHLQVLSQRPDFDSAETEIVDVVGSLCENNDKFAIQRPIPKTQPGDIIVIDTVGAHGHAMGFQYNGRLRSAEVLLTAAGPELIRRAETAENYFATLRIKEKDDVSTN